MKRVYISIFRSPCLSVFIELLVTISFLLVIIYRGHQTLALQWIQELKVETKSGWGGKIFRVGWKGIHGKGETDSWLGGKLFMVRRKENQGCFH